MQGGMEKSHVEDEGCSIKMRLCALHPFSEICTEPTTISPLSATDYFALRKAPFRLKESNSARQGKH